MNRLTVSSLSGDHTFKISRNIGFVREKDYKFVTQFHQLFICLNERGEVVAWKLNWVEVLQWNWRLSYPTQEKAVFFWKLINASLRGWRCPVSSKYSNIVPNISVKLDLFHACQRITRTFSRQNALHKEVSNSFVQIFRDDDDQGEKRLKSTVYKEKTEKKS